MQTSDLEAQAVIDSVSAAFPKHSRTVVQEVLQNGQFDVNEATDKLLKLKVSSRDKAQTRRRSTHFSGQTRGTGTQLGWQALTEQRSVKSTEKQIPDFSFRAKTPVVDSLASFPALHLPAAHPASSSPWVPRPPSASQPRTPDKTAEQPNSRRFSEVARPLSGQFAPQKRQVIESGQEAELVNKLVKAHRWADAGLVQDLLVEVGQDEAAADLLLGGMVTQSARPASAPSSPVPTAQISGTGSAPCTPEATASDRSTDDAAVAQPDIYRKHRRSASQLTRRWQKAVHAATSAFAGGDHSGAGKLAQQARKLREAALAAHAQAALAIEHEHNEARSMGLGVLDLHGLHTSEATAALDRRLDALKQLRSVAGQRQGLQVIVGIGKHSSEGEGSIGRAVESHLLGLNLHFRKHGGVVILDNL